MTERAALARVKAIVDLYFEPWGSSKADRWKQLTGANFDAEEALTAIHRVLHPKPGDPLA